VQKQQVYLGAAKDTTRPNWENLTAFQSLCRMWLMMQLHLARLWDAVRFPPTCEKKLHPTFLG